jgi:iron complex transport system substrate-binding protein
MKKLFSLLLALAMLLSFAACANPGSTTSGTTTGDNASAATSYPLTVTDQAGRTVTIEKEPQKLVSGYYISTSAIIALDIKDRLVGIEAKANKRAIYSLSAPELIALPSVGTAKEFDLEGCVALSPDLVILPLKLKSAAETLTSLGIDVLLVNPENQTLLEEMVTLIGKATNTQAKAAELLGFISAQTDRLSAALANAAKPKVYLAGNSSMLSTAGDAMYQSDMIRLAGGTNVAASITDTYWVETSYEQLLAWNPEYIILASDATYTVDDVLSDPNLADCDAVKNGKVYKMPSKAEAWDSPVPSGILGAVWLSAVLHPEVCTEASVNDIIDTYYETFYGFKYSEK